jgi:ELWxxDGT repeat protein
LPNPAGRFRPLLARGDVAYFVGNDGVHGKELWKTDGTATGTVMVKDIVPGSTGGLGVSDTTRGLAAWAVTEDGTLFFLRLAPGSGWELWRSDGTEAGTISLGLVVPGSTPSSSLDVHALGDLAYFTGPADPSGLRLWQSDGTEAGTQPFPELIPTSGATSRDGALYFARQESRNPIEVRVLEAGASASSVIGVVAGDGAVVDSSQLTTAGGRPYFSATDGVRGRELWASSCGDGVVEHDEVCDDGAANGAVGSCCTRGCEVRTWPESDVDDDGPIDWCDAEEGSLDVDLVTVRRSRAARGNVRILAAGRFAVEPLGFDSSSGFALRVADAAALQVSAAFSPWDCRTKGDVTRCRTKAGSADLRLRSDGDRILLRLALEGPAGEAPVVGPLTVTLTHGKVLDRVGESGPCTGSGARLSCA